MTRIVGSAYALLGLLAAFASCDPYAQGDARRLGFGLALLFVAFVAAGVGILVGTRWGLALGVVASAAGAYLAAMAVGAELEELAVRPGTFARISAPLLAVAAAAFALAFVALVRALRRR